MVVVDDAFSIVIYERSITPKIATDPRKKSHEPISITLLPCDLLLNTSVWFPIFVDIFMICYVTKFSK